MLGVARLACHPARLTRRGRRRGRGLDAIEPLEALGDVGARAPPVIDGKTGARGGHEQQDEQQLMAAVVRHARTIARGRAGF